MLSKTEDKYAKKLDFWFRYCKWAGVDATDASPIVTTLFVSYLFAFSELKEKGAQSVCTALSHYFATALIPWVRSTAFSKALAGYKYLRPSEKYPRRPLCQEHLITFVELNLFDLSTFDGAMQWACILTHYYFLLRGGEGCAELRENSARDSKHGISRDQFRFQFRRNVTKAAALYQIILNLANHKGDKHGERNAEVASGCTCNIYQPTCGIHAIFRYDILRGQMPWRRTRKQYFCWEDGRRFTRPDLQKLLQECIGAINRIKGLMLRVKEYKPHSMRSGRTTDMARAGVNPIFIKRAGRWQSDVWDNEYTKLSFSDVSMVADRSLAELNLAVTNIQAVNERKEEEGDIPDTVTIDTQLATDRQLQAPPMSHFERRCARYIRDHPPKQSDKVEADDDAPPPPEPVMPPRPDFSLALPDLNMNLHEPVEDSTDSATPATVPYDSFDRSSTATISQLITSDSMTNNDRVDRRHVGGMLQDDVAVTTPMFSDISGLSMHQRVKTRTRKKAVLYQYPQ